MKIINIIEIYSVIILQVLHNSGKELHISYFIMNYS